MTATNDDGCEFCSQAFNRPAGDFRCPYCRRVWNDEQPHDTPVVVPACKCHEDVKVCPAHGRRR